MHLRRENKVDNVRKNIIGRTSLEVLGRNTMKIRSERNTPFGQIYDAENARGLL